MEMKKSRMKRKDLLEQRNRKFKRKGIKRKRD